MLKGKLSISRVYSNQENDYIQIELADEISGTKFVQVKLTPETFANVVTGLSYQECEFELNNIDLVGLKRENTHYLVPKPEKYQKDKDATAEADKLLAPFEIDGWKAVRYDLYNHHNWWGDKVRVGFVRYVSEATQCDETCQSDS